MHLRVDFSLHLVFAGFIFSKNSVFKVLDRFSTQREMSTRKFGWAPKNEGDELLNVREWVYWIDFSLREKCLHKSLVELLNMRKWDPKHEGMSLLDRFPTQREISIQKFGWDPINEGMSSQKWGNELLNRGNELLNLRKWAYWNDFLLREKFLHKSLVDFLQMRKWAPKNEEMTSTLWEWAPKE